jgi:hypothetical protein
MAVSRILVPERSISLPANFLYVCVSYGQACGIGVISFPTGKIQCGASIYTHL